MTRIYNTTGRFALTFTALLLAGMSAMSCVKEDLSKCPPVDGPQPPTTDSTTFKIKLTHVQTDVPVTEADMKRAVIYIFDEIPIGDNDQLRAVIPIENPVFDHEYDTGLVLPFGGYEVTVWINPDDPYSIYPGETQESFSGKAKGDGQIMLNIPEDNIAPEQLPYQLWGGALHSIVEPSEFVTPDPNMYLATIPMYLNNYVVSMTTKGLAADSDTYAFRIADNNGAYDFNNNYIAGDDFHYETTATFAASGTTRAGDDALKASITTLKIGDGRSPELSLRNDTDGKTIYPANAKQPNNLVAMIESLQSGDPDFINKHRYDVLLDFDAGKTDDGGNVVPDIWINGWKLVQEDVIIVE